MKVQNKLKIQVNSRAGLLMRVLELEPDHELVEAGASAEYIFEHFEFVFACFPPDEHIKLIEDNVLALLVDLGLAEELPKLEFFVFLILLHSLFGLLINNHCFVELSLKIGVILGRVMELLHLLLHHQLHCSAEEFATVSQKLPAHHCFRSAPQ